MANSYSQIYIQIVFAVRSRDCFIRPEWEEELYKYITGIVQGRDQKMLAINGIPNHIHFLIGMKPTCCISDLVREVKKSSTAFIRENRLIPFQFNWQEGFGAFSYSRWDMDMIIKYIQNQKVHHKKVTFQDEYKELLKTFGIEHQEKYLFDWLE